MTHRSLVGCRRSALVGAALAAFSTPMLAVGAESASQVHVPHSDVVFQTWEGNDGTPHYAISLDGREYSRPRATSYSLMLRYGAFDPLGDAPAPEVNEALAAGPDTSLYIVQYRTQPLQVYGEQLEALGVEPYFYLPYHSFVVRMDAEIRAAVEALPYVRWVGDFHPAYKLDELILTALEQGASLDAMADYSVQAMTPGPEAQERIGERIVALGGSVMNTAPDGYRMTVTMSLSTLLEIVRMDETHFIDPWGPGETDMDVIRQLTGASTVLAPAGYTGQGVRGEVFDTGTQNGHPEWGGTSVLYHGPGASGSHGTSVYGICFAVGVNPSATGTNPNYERGISNYYINSTQFGGGTTRLTQNTEATDPAGPYRSVFQTSSVGSPRTTQYTTISAETDDYLFRVDYLSCQSMSNANLVPQTRPQAWAKNIIGVGGITHSNSLNRLTHRSSGSTGPAADGRIKPDLAAMYDSIFTTTSGNGYTNFGGTSGATPIICSHSGLVQQMWHEGVFPGRGGGSSVFADRMQSTTAKAMMINTAYRYTWTAGGNNANMWRTRQGWGMVDVGKLYDYRDRIFVIDEEDVLTNLQVATYPVVVAGGEPELNVTMAYRDPAGSPGAGVHRINDLSLKVISPSGTQYWGNNGLMAGNWSTSGGTSNTLDTVENVFVQNPQAGTWTVEIHADEVIQDSHLETPQVDADFALVVTGATGGSCAADVNGDNVVNVLDLIAVLSAWGPCPGCPEDVNGDNVVNVLDLIEVLSNWGPCP